MTADLAARQRTDSIGPAKNLPKTDKIGSGQLRLEGEATDE